MKKIICLILCFLFSACASNKLSLKQVDYSDLPGWEKDRHGQALKAFLKSCEAMQKPPKDKYIHKSTVGGKFSTWQELCYQAKNTSPEQAQNFFEQNFIPFKAKNGWHSRGLFTGYYQANLNGSLYKHDRYIYPVYKKPKITNFSRKEIDEGALKNKGLELAWVDDPVELFFMQIQGSGIIRLDNGKKLHVGYAGQNNYPYTPIGRIMAANGLIDKKKISAQTIKSWLYSNKDKVESVLQNNRSYVYFREIPARGPIGGQGVPLTHERSLAIDKKFIPYGIPIWLDVNINGTDDYHGYKFQQLVVAQDTGGAIKGPIRGDIFFGRTKKASELSGTQNSLGSYYLLLPKNNNL